MTKREQYKALYEELGSYQAVADHLGVSRQAVQQGMSRPPSAREKWWENPEIDWTHSNQEIAAITGRTPGEVQRRRLIDGRPTKRVIRFEYEESKQENLTSLE